MDPSFLSVLTALFVVAFTCFIYYFVILAVTHPLQNIAGLPKKNWFHCQLDAFLEPSRSSKVHEYCVQKYGRSLRVQGVFPFEQRLITLDPLSMNHVLKNSTIYEKPWPSRRLITSLIGEGMLAAEGLMHKRQRRVATPAFSIQNLRGLVPVVFAKGNQLKDRWMQMIREQGEETPIDVCHWISRATFDVIGLAGFDYNFNAIQDESNELFMAYKDMFETAVSQSSPWVTLCRMLFPSLFALVREPTMMTIKRCQGVIHKVAGDLIQDKKAKIAHGIETGVPYAGRDLLSLLLKSNVAQDLPKDQRISDADILHNINTFMFAGSDTSSLSITWTLLLLAQNPAVQDRLRKELLAVLPTSSSTSTSTSTSSTSPTALSISDLTEDEQQSLYTTLAGLPFLDNVVRESIRLIPPVHSSLRVATRDDEIPVSKPYFNRDMTPGTRPTIRVSKGTMVHVSIEGFNLDREVWGEDAWEFRPDRWDRLPEEAAKLPGLYSNTLSFSGGPRSCIGLRFSLIEIKAFLYILLTNFDFKTTEDVILKANVVLTRPFVKGKYAEGSQCPLIVSPYTGE